MAHYTLHPSPETFSSRRFLLGPPLVLVAAFCFGLVLMQPHNNSPASSVSASRPASKISSQPKLSSKISPVSQSEVSQDSTTTDSTVSSQPAPNTTATSSSNVSSNPTANPQVSNNSGPKLQPAGTNTPAAKDTDKSQPGLLKKTAKTVTSTLDNLIH